MHSLPELFIWHMLKHWWFWVHKFLSATSMFFHRVQVYFYTNAVGVLFVCVLACYYGPFYF